MAKEKKAQTSRTSRSKKASGAKRPRVRWPFPRATLEQALAIPNEIKDKNGGNPWGPEELRKAAGAGTGGNAFYYLTAASRDYGLTIGTSSGSKIGLADLGRDLVYAPNQEVEKQLKIKAFLNVDVFKKVLEYYNGSNLPEMRYLGNTLTKEFGLNPETHEEFSKTFRENCEYLGITSGQVPPTDEEGATPQADAPNVVTLAEAKGSSKLTAFVIMPFVEHDGGHPSGFFSEVLRSLITPAAKEAGFNVRTANRQGSDLIQSTIVNDLLGADLVVADLTEHNPNVLFELGMRLAEGKPVVLMKATGTKPLFDVDNMLRVYEYNSNLWQTTVDKDLPNFTEFIKGAWDNRSSEKTYIKLLRSTGKSRGS